MKAIVLNQRKERDTLLARNYQPRTTRYDEATLLASPMIKLISGPRRVGKSTYALLLLRGQNFAYLNFDDAKLLSQWDEQAVMHALNDVYPGYQYMLLDEIQNLPDWDLWVSKLYRNGFNLIITGSNAKMLSSEMATVLTGRYLQIEMMPFSLKETMTWTGVAGPPTEDFSDVAVCADTYLRSGGYPETLQAGDLASSYLSTLFDATVWKDIARRHNVRNTPDLNNLATYLLTNFCNPFSANELTRELNLASVTTVKKYMGYLHEPYLFFFLSRYNNKLKLMRKAPQKVYVVDNGFVQAKGFNLSDNLGRLLENQVFVELLRQGYNTEHSLFYYRSRNDREVDFVLRRGTQVESLTQVCYDLSSPKTEKREVEALVECSEELHCTSLRIVTFREERTITKGSNLIQVIPVWKL